jgi:hypothetical protein
MMQERRGEWLAVCGGGCSREFVVVNECVMLYVVCRVFKRR